MREIPYAGQSIEAVRSYANNVVNLASLRAVATTIPLSHSTLHNFLDGADPHPRVRRILFAWYKRQHGEGAEVRATLDTLVQPFKDDDRLRLRGALLDVLIEHYLMTGQPVPSWLEGMRDDPA